MFEYLMPLIVMRPYPGTLLDETYNAVVQRPDALASHVARSCAQPRIIGRAFRFQRRARPQTGDEHGTGAGARSLA